MGICHQSQPKEAQVGKEILSACGVSVGTKWEGTIQYRNPREAGIKNEN
jgi:hypothetical protein